MSCHWSAPDPDNNARAWYNKGLCLERIALKERVTILKQYQHDELEEAIECYDRAIAIDPSHAAAWNNKGTTFAGLSDTESQLDALRRP